MNTNFLALVALLTLSGTPGFAETGVPVSMTLASADEFRRGEPVTVIAVMHAAIDIPFATFAVAQPEEWQLLDGITRWAGPMQKGKAIELRFRAVALADTPKPIMSSLDVDGFPVRTAALELERMGRRFPERMRVETGDSKDEARNAGEQIRVEYDPNVTLPEPQGATLPRVPGEEPSAVTETRKSKSNQRRASVVASGRFTYIDDRGERRGLRNATVELWNEDPIAVLNEFCGRAVTDGDGNFSVAGDCGDLFSNPDLFVQLVLKNSVVEVKPDSLFSGTYVVRSATKQDSPGGALNFGTLTVPSSRAGAAQAHNLIMRAQQFMAARGESMSKVTVLWPSTSDSSVAFYTPILATLNIKSAEPFTSEGTLFHEYGHHVLDTKAESPSPDYANGICDFNGQVGHCLSRPEKGAIAWTEGWPNFFAAVVYDSFNGEDGYGCPIEGPCPNGVTPFFFDIENFTPAAGFENQADHIEGVIAAILWDLVDNGTPAESGDNIDLTFTNIWDVIKQFDPSGSLLHNHPTSIHELYDGLREARLGSINRISEAYGRNGINKPLPDLQVTVLQSAPTEIPRGASFSNNSTVRNNGGELANSGFAVSYVLQSVTNPRAFTVPVGTRNVTANLAAASNNAATLTLTLPATMAPGTYRLRACADNSNNVPESSESNNCTMASGTIEVTQ